MLKEYEELLHKKDKTEKESSKLKHITLALYQQGYIKNTEKAPRR